MENYKKINEKTTESIEDFLSSSADIIMNLTLDNNRLLSNVPIVSFALEVLRMTKNWRDARFIEQINSFFEDLFTSNISDEDKNIFLKKHFTNDKDKYRVTEIILTSIDQNNDIKKIKLLAKIFEVFIKDEINRDDFEVFIDVFNNINRQDVKVIEFLYKNVENDGLKIKDIDISDDFRNTYKYGVSKKLEMLLLVKINARTWISLEDSSEAIVSLTDLGILMSKFLF